MGRTVILAGIFEYVFGNSITIADFLTGFAIVTPRLSDVIGCRAAVLGSWIIFAAFSLGCGLSQSLNQLIICRAFQGIGGTGLFSMTLVIIPKVTPVQRWAFATSLSGITVGTASVLGMFLF